MIEAFFLNEIEQIEEYVYVSSYFNLHSDYLFSIKSDNGYITYIENRLGAKDGGNGETTEEGGNCFTEKFGECVRTVTNQMTDGSGLGTGALLGCMIFGGGCAAAITVACTTMAANMCIPGGLKSLN